MDSVKIDRDELDFIALAACSLDESPGSNWVEKVGGLPDYICRIARAIKRSGKPTGTAIAIAVSRTKKWCAGVGNVNADTRAKACAAAAAWEAKKARSKARTAKRVAASDSDYEGVVFLAASYNIEIVAEAWDSAQKAARLAWIDSQTTTNAEWNADHSSGGPAAAAEPMDVIEPPYLRLKEIWNDHIIVSTESVSGDIMFKVPYEVDDNGNVMFGEPVEVKEEYVEVEDVNITDQELESMLSNPEDADCGCVESEDDSVAMTTSRGSGYSVMKYNDPRILELSVLTTTGRKRLAESDFAIPEKRAYPIHDLAHARNAMARVSAYGTPEEKRRVKEAVCKKYPALCERAAERAGTAAASVEPDENDVELAVLSPEKRASLKPGDFAIPDKKAYPIHDEAHAKNALARVSQFGTDAEKEMVRKAVCKKYPAMCEPGDEGPDSEDMQKDMGDAEDMMKSSVSQEDSVEEVELTESEEEVELTESEEDAEEAIALSNEALVEYYLSLSDPNTVSFAVLTSESRGKLKTGDFAIPEKRAYPIHDEAHARAALAYAAKVGSPEDKKRVRAAVCKRYPSMCGGISSAKDVPTSK